MNATTTNTTTQPFEAFVAAMGNPPHDDDDLRAWAICDKDEA